MKVVLALSMLCVSCGVESSVELSGESNVDVTADVTKYHVEGVPVDYASIARVVAQVEKVTGRTVASPLTIVVVEKPFHCAGDVKGLYNGCAENVDGMPTITVDRYQDRTGIYTFRGNMTCSLLVHELVHHIYADGAHEDPSLWYGKGGMVRRVLESMHCPVR